MLLGKREGIENINGRPRRDLPRKTDLNALSEHDLEQIMVDHNLMPRKVLNAKNPLEAFALEIGYDILFLFNNSVALRGWMGRKELKVEVYREPKKDTLGSSPTNKQKRP